MYQNTNQPYKKHLIICVYIYIYYMTGIVQHIIKNWKESAWALKIMTERDQSWLKHFGML